MDYNVYGHIYNVINYTNNINPTNIDVLTCDQILRLHWDHVNFIGWVIYQRTVWDVFAVPIWKPM